MRGFRLLRTGVVVFLAAAACGEGTTGESLTTSGFPATTTAPRILAPGTTEDVAATVTPATPQLLVIGDWGSGTKSQTDVAGAMSRYVGEHDILAILTTGDNFYMDDAEVLMHPFEWATKEDIEFWVTWGNHDIETGARIEAVNSTFRSPPRWAVYSWGPVDVIVLDSNQVDSAEQIDFLVGALSQSDRPAIVAFHHPALSCSNHGDTDEILDRWVPLFDDEVVLVLNGHDHNYQRFESDNIAYVVSGGGGRHLYDLEACSEDHSPRLAGEKLFHFLALGQADAELTIEAIDVNGAVIDDVTIALADQP